MSLKFNASEPLFIFLADVVKYPQHQRDILRLLLIREKIGLAAKIRFSFTGKTLILN